MLAEQTIFMNQVLSKKLTNGSAIFMVYDNKAMTMVQKGKT